MESPERCEEIAQVVLHGKEQLVLLRPMGRLLAMIVLHHDDEVAKPEAFEDEAPQVELSAEEQKLTKMLVDASTAKKFDFAKYKDTYTEKLIELINAKVAGKEIVAPPVHEQAQIINLMDALRQSVEQAQKPAAGEAAGKPPKKMAPSVRKREWARGKQSG